MMGEETITAKQSCPPLTSHSGLLKWVNEIAALCAPDAVYWCNGIKEEYDNLFNKLVEKGTFIRLDQKKRPNSFACFSDPSDVARVEDRTFICSRNKEDAGPTNNWMEPGSPKLSVKAAAAMLTPNKSSMD